MALETQVKNSCGEFTVFVDPDPLTYRSGEDIYTVQVINRTRTTAMDQPGYVGTLTAGVTTDGMAREDAYKLYQRVRSAADPEAYLRAVVRNAGQP